MGGEDLKNCHQLLISTVRPAPPVTCVDADDVDAIAINRTPNGIRPRRQEAAVSRAENVTDLAVCVRAAVWLWRFYCQNVRVPRRSIAENGRLREHVISFGDGEASAIESARYPHTGGCVDSAHSWHVGDQARGGATGIPGEWYQGTDAITVTVTVAVGFGEVQLKSSKHWMLLYLHLILSKEAARPVAEEVFVGKIEVPLGACRGGGGVPER
mmetsp:Transcript_4237/g.8805  ORF Transcript_4237/g.8805 Transcript_4237/m.8805 type:complete len:213 (+) Transcript_4237:55-693(+)